MKRPFRYVYGGYVYGLILVVFLAAFWACDQRAPAPDFSSFEDTQRKKEAFFEFLSPIVARENSRILSQRERLLKVVEKTRKEGEVPFWDRRWLADLADSYEVDLNSGNPDSENLDSKNIGSETSGSNTPGAGIWQRLLRRVDTVPGDLVLVQAAIESAWGTSRFAREGNNFFGEHCTAKGCGLVPEARPPGQDWEVEVFDSPAESIRSYLKNINTHAAYADLRRMRAALRNKGKQPEGVLLARALEDYSERGEAYVRDVQAMIRSNREDLP